jgi:HemY protein
VFGLRRKTLGWFGSRRRRKANLQTVAATLAMAEGHYSQAEKLMLKGADNSDTPLLNYLSAAKVAQARGDDVRRDHYLQKAQEENPKAELALTLIQTQLQIEQGQYDSALGRLESVYALNPRHPMVLDQLRQVYLAREDWAALIDLAPALRKVGKLTAQQEEPCCTRRGAVVWRPPAASSTPCAGLAGLPRKQRQDPVLLASYGDRLRRFGADAEAADLWLEALRKDPSPSCSPACPSSNWTTTSPC